MRWEKKIISQCFCILSQMLPWETLITFKYFFPTPCPLKVSVTYRECVYGTRIQQLPHGHLWASSSCHSHIKVWPKIIHAPTTWGPRWHESWTYCASASLKIFWCDGRHLLSVLTSYVLVGLLNAVKNNNHLPIYQSVC